MKGKLRTHSFEENPLIFKEQQWETNEELQEQIANAMTNSEVQAIVIIKEKPSEK